MATKKMLSIEETIVNRSRVDNQTAMIHMVAQDGPRLTLTHFRGAIEHRISQLRALSKKEGGKTYSWHLEVLQDFSTIFNVLERGLEMEDDGEDWRV